MRATRTGVLWAGTLAFVALASAAFTIAYMNSEDESVADASVSECSGIVDPDRMQACLTDVAATRLRQEADSPTLGDPRLWYSAGTVLAVGALVLFALWLAQQEEKWPRRATRL